MESVFTNNQPLFEYFENFRAENVEMNENDEDFAANVESLQTEEEEEMKVFVRNLFSKECSIDSIGKFFYHRLKQIETSYLDEFNDIKKKSKLVLRDFDLNTFQRVKSSLIFLYRGIVNIQNGHAQNSVILLPCNYSDSAVYYTKDGIILSLHENSQQRINHVGRLLTYVFMTLMFYESFLTIIHDPHASETSSEFCLRYLYYVLKMLLDASDNSLKNDSFISFIGRLYVLLEINMHSVLIRNIERDINIRVHGDLFVTSYKKKHNSTCTKRNCCFQV